MKGRGKEGAKKDGEPEGSVEVEETKVGSKLPILRNRGKVAGSRIAPSGQNQHQPPVGFVVVEVMRTKEELLVIQVR